MIYCREALSARLTILLTFSKAKLVVFKITNVLYRSYYDSYIAHNKVDYQ